MVDRFPRFACVLLAIHVLATGVASAQIVSGDGAVDPFAQIRAQVLAAEDGVVVEGPVDPTAYLVGPGDVFAVSIGGALPLRQSLSVGADGRLVIPEAGGIFVSGLSLEQARAAILAQLVLSFENVGVDVSLEKPRQFFVHVTGAVPLPGKYLASAVSRLDDAVQLAYAKRQFDMEVARSGRSDVAQESIDRAVPHPSSERPSMPQEYRPSLRGINIQHANGSESRFDLLRYYATGDRRENPYLLDGDVINVPSFHEDRTSIRVDGPLPFAGTYPFMEADRLSDILTIANGSADLSGIEEVRITTRNPEGPTTTTISSLDIPWEQRIGTTDDPLLTAGDFVRVSEEEIESAALYGWVRFPATYPIVGGKTTISQLVKMGGGLRHEADIRLAYVERYNSTVRKGEPGTSDLDFFSRTFFDRSKTATRLHVDVAAILRGEAEDYRLEHGDAVVFPRGEDVVYVVGNVVQGGYVPFVEGQPASYYVELSGGFAPQSRDVYVYDVTSGQVAKGANATVLSGSTIYVDREGFAETPELQSLLLSERTSRRQLRLASTQTIISGITAITAIVTTVIAITR